MSLPELNILWFNRYKNNVHEPFVGRILSLDPGKTTGYAVFEVNDTGIKLFDCGQLETAEFEPAIIALENLFLRISPSKVIMEEYRVYGHKTDMHAHDDMHTSQLIGIIKMICIKHSLTPKMQGASMAKGFCKDDKLKAWGLWQKGKRHARDAIRHALYWLLFTHPKKGE